MKQLRWLAASLAALFFALGPAPARLAAGDAVGSETESVQKQLQEIEGRIKGLQSDLQVQAKAIDDLLWYDRLGDSVAIDKVIFVGPPDPNGKETYGIKNERHPLKIYQYVFTSSKLDKKQKHPLIVFPHGGVHAEFTTYYAHIVRELVDMGYVVVAPEYRGSTGYGREFYEAIDYGGLEVDDVVAGRDWAVENLSYVDAARVGIIGWSHGGLIALMASFDHPEKFQAAYAGVPVSDLLARMGYADDEYRAEFAAPYHLGKTANQDVAEYRRRSPAYNAEKLKIPLLVHTTTNDRDVNVVEVEHLIQALKAAGKSFESKIYPDAPGGHSFNRIDTSLARQSRQEIYAFLARYLKP